MSCGCYVRVVLLSTLFIGSILFAVAATQIDPILHFLGNILYSALAVLVCYGIAAFVSTLVALFIYFVCKCRTSYDDVPSEEAIRETYR